MTDEFSIGTLASRTGVTTNVLRTWEQRFGFPSGRRTPSGHRRFTEHDVTAVREVLQAREHGVPLQLAVESVMQGFRHRQEESVHATLVRDFPDLRPQRLGRATLVAASHAIEDECLARADRSLVLGTFQRGHEYSRSSHRWVELARTSTWAAVLADFTTGPSADPQALPALCHLPEASPLRREWSVVVISPSFSAVLAAWEVPSSPARPPTYEAVVTLRRSPAVAAARVLVATARSGGATPPPEVDQLLAPPLALDASSSDADRLLLRILARVDQRTDGSPTGSR